MNNNFRNTTIRNVCFTINNPIHKIEITDPDLRYLVYQLEEGENHTHHYQGYIEWKKPIRFLKLKEIIGQNPHMEQRFGSQKQAIDYCKKEPRLDGPWEQGERAMQGRRTDLEDVADCLKNGETVHQVAMSYPSTFIKYPRGIRELAFHCAAESSTKYTEVRCIAIWGPPGVGKTKSVYDTYPLEEIYSVSYNNPQWWDGYERQKVLLLDDFYGQIRLSDMLHLLDVYPMQLPIKGGYTFKQWKIVIMTSNTNPEFWYHNIDPSIKQALFRRFTVSEVAGNTIPPLPSLE